MTDSTPAERAARACKCLNTKLCGREIAPQIVDGQLRAARTWRCAHCEVRPDVEREIAEAVEEKSKIVEKLLADGESLMRACRDWEAIAKREIGRREVEQAKLEAERARVLRLLDELAAMHGPLAFIGKVQLRDAIASGREEL